MAFNSIILKILFVLNCQPMISRCNRNITLIVFEFNIVYTSVINTIYVFHMFVFAWDSHSFISVLA